MVRTRVASSVVAAVAYDDEAHTLDVELVNGRVYRYYLVPRDIYEALLVAESVGQFFNIGVRNDYPCRRLQ